MKNQITVVHHSADHDGIFCREIAKKFLPDATLIGWDFKDPKIAFPTEGEVYVLDLSPECFQSIPEHTERIIWIDHHKTSIEKWNPGLNGYRIDGVAACRLAWQWFSAQLRYSLATTLTGSENDKWFKDHYPFPMKQDFVDRGVHEPIAVRLAGEYDIWDKRDPDSETFQCALRATELSDHIWKGLLDPSINETIQVQESQIMTYSLMENGHAVQYYCRNQDSSIIQNQGFDLDWEGFHFLALNSARCNSLSFLAGLKPEHDGCLAFKWTGKGWMVSLYGCPGKPNKDFSAVATKYGGGGHKQACGFTCQTLPFTL